MVEEQVELHLKDHTRILQEKMRDFLHQGTFSDLTFLCSDGEKIKAHKIILAAYSPLFEYVLTTEEKQCCSNLTFLDISKNNMELLLEIIYTGSVNVPKASVAAILTAAQKLQIRGIERKEDNKPQMNVPTPSKSANRSLLPSTSPVAGSSRDRVSMIINPFAIRRKNSEDSDSTCVGDDLSPGPSNAQNLKKQTASEITNVKQEGDSDVEFIAENSAIVILNDTQNSCDAPWLSKTHSKNKRPLVNKKSSDDSDNSEIVSNHLKKVKRVKRLNSDDSDSTISNPSNARTNLFARELRVTVSSNNQSIATKQAKNKSRRTLSKNQFLKMSFKEVRNYCVICKSFQRKCQQHIQSQHRALLSKKKKFTCHCSKTFFFRYCFQKHKCAPEKKRF